MRHDAAAVAIGRRALGCAIRRRTAPPPPHRSDAVGHRTVQARPGSPGREGPRPRVPGPRTRSVPPGRGAKAGDQCAHNRSGHTAEHVAQREFMVKYRPQSLLQRLIEPEEIANMVVYLASPFASATTGGAVRVDGGYVDSILP
ncbi:SDR family oxidoreductase [Streptomyces sp. NPDC087787]|uniref:SDR family oxidoreductase n=1 Tax=Streptomyces sp. NPDC087787 TaxID=3365803 RepID=UPI003816CAA9